MFRKFSGSIKKTILCSVAILLFFILISPISIAQEDVNGADDEGLIPGDQPATDGDVQVKDDGQTAIEEEQKPEVQNEPGANEEETDLPLMPWKVAEFIVVAVISAGALMVLIGYRADKCLSSGEIRRAIAAVLVLGFVMITILSIAYRIPNKEIVTSYTQLVGVIIGFYFGSKIASEAGDEEGEKMKKVAKESFDKIAEEAKKPSSDENLKTIQQLVKDGEEALEKCGK
jgi:hypothetical protein